MSDSWMEYVSDPPPEPVKRVDPTEGVFAGSTRFMMTHDSGRVSPTWFVKPFWQPEPFVSPLRSRERKGPFTCNRCGKTITGTRYECLYCEDYDLCVACEARIEDDAFHPLHPMIKFSE